MQSTGNDIVALCGTNSEKTNNERFYRQILSVAELELFNISACHHLAFETFVWMAWSVKEAAYKYVKRLQPNLVFSPTRTEIRELHPPEGMADQLTEEIDISGPGLWRGMVICGDHSCFFRTKTDAEFIASIVGADDDFEDTYWGIRKTEEPGADGSVLVRNFILEKLRSFFPGEGLVISPANSSFPVLNGGGVHLSGIPISFSHHEQFVSYVFTDIGTRRHGWEDLKDTIDITGL